MPSAAALIPVASRIDHGAQSIAWRSSEGGNDLLPSQYNKKLELFLEALHRIYAYS